MRNLGAAIFFLILTVSSGQKRILFGQDCSTDTDCRDHSLRCTRIDEASNSRKCQCEVGSVWNQITCEKPGEKDEHAAKVIAIAAPILGAAFMIVLFSFMCCYWFHTVSKSVKKDLSVEKYNEKELDLFHEEEEEVKDKKSNSVRNTRKASMKTVDETGSSSKLKRPPAKKANSVKEETELNDQVSPQSNSNSPSDGEEKEETKPPSNDGYQGYQSSMRRLLTMPQMHSEPSTRPPSAHYIGSSSRPGTAVTLSRPRSAATIQQMLLNPRESSSGLSLSRRSPVGFIGPYVTDASVLRRPRSPNPSVILSPEPEVEPEVKLSELYDKVAKAAEKEEKKRSEKKERKKKELSEANAAAAKEDESKIVRVAVKVFKRRKNMKRAKEEQRRRKKRELESLVDQIVRMREEEEAVVKGTEPKTQAKNRQNRRRESSFSQGSSNTSSQTRPESVAQKVLRERQEKKIKDKVPVTPKALPIKEKAKEKQQQPKSKPLHVALRQSATSKNLNRKELTEQIKQQVHLNAVRNYQAPSLAQLELMALEQKPIKSILKKKTTATTTQAKKKVSRVNYAFDGDDEKENKV